MRQRRWYGLGVLLFLAVTGGCGDDSGSRAPEPLPAESLPGVYSGDFPCDGCPGIPSRLWIRADGRFFFEQQYPAGEGHDTTNVYGLGRWSPGADPHQLHLDGSGPRRTFTRVDRDTLVLQTPSSLEHRLTRDEPPRDFTATVRMNGMVRPREGGMEFSECLTGYSVPVSRSGDFSRFHHQYRSIGGREGPLYVELEGRFSWSSDGRPQALTIERFVTIRTGANCS